MYLGTAVLTESEYKAIQNDAFKKGMTEAGEIANKGPLNPGVLRTLHDPDVRTLVEAYQKGQSDALSDLCNAILAARDEP